MKHEADFFDDHDPQLVYIARRLREAKRVEALFDEAGIDYGVEPDKYMGGFIFRSERVGAFFYVRPDTVAAAREALTANKLKPHDGPQP